MGPRRGRGAKGARKISKVLREFKTGSLTSSSGTKVRKRKQAVAIALSEAREAGAANRKKRKVAGKKATAAKQSPVSGFC